MAHCVASLACFKMMSPTWSVVLLCQFLLYTTVTSKKVVVCGRPPITDGIDESVLKRVYEAGEEVTLSCERGYLPSTPSPRRISCSGTGDWTSSDLACSPIMCPIPKALQSLAMGRTEAPFKSILNFTCDDGYVMLGFNSSSCLHDSTWDNPPPICKAVNCPLPRPPVDGRIVHENNPFTGANTIYGQGWTYECNSPKAPSYERGSCMADGTVPEPPTCRDVSCPIPTSVPNGVITFAVMKEHRYKETVKYACNEHYIMEGEPDIRCTNTGNWSTKPICKAPCQVPIKRGRIFYNAKKIWIEDFKPNRVLHKEVVVFYCKNKPEKCGYPVASVCNDGVLPLPECFAEPGKIEYNLKAKTLPSEIPMCAVPPPAATSAGRTVQ